MNLWLKSFLMPSFGNMLHLSTTFFLDYCIICTVTLFRVVFPMDLCSQFSTDTVETNFRHGVAPRGGVNAGNFYKSDTAKNFENCVESCCKSLVCNVAFYFNDDCLLISCNTTWPDGCEPEKQPGEQFRDSLWLTLRTLEKVDGQHYSLPLSNIPVETCETDTDCRSETEVCRTTFMEFTAKRRCECAPGFFRNSDNLPCIKMPVSKSQTCIVGVITDCLPEEDCIPKNSRSRFGTCHCRDGYIRNAPSSSCVLDAVNTSLLAKGNENAKNLTTVAIKPSLSSTTIASTTLTSVLFNQWPVAKVVPISQEIHFPGDLVIDGSGSSDDINVTSYRWEVILKPTDFQFQIKSSEVIKPVLRLKYLIPGFYQFKLTVTDNAGQYSSVLSNATVIREVDNPPVADAGQDVVVTLPSASVVLYGNASYDDKKIVAYEWRRKSADSPAVDMEGVRTPYLKIDGLQVGKYIFSLQVTDSSGHTSVADVNVLVQPEENQPPVALAGPNQTVFVPVGVIFLNGSRSYDDQRIESYTWILISGPSPSSVIINNPQSAIGSVSKLAVGQYLFQLTVKDEKGLKSQATTAVNVKEATSNSPPVAHAGGNLVVVLPVNVVMINGSQSNDDMGIVSYFWRKDRSSPAAGDILLNSDHEPVLQLVNVVSGRYLFTLEVKDAEGLTNRDTMSLIIQPDPLELNLVELRLITDASSFSEQDKVILTSKVALMLGNFSSSGTIEIVIHSIKADLIFGSTVIIFYVETVIGDKRIIWSGLEIVKLLKKTISSSLKILDFHITQFDTFVCQNNCSGHGICDSITRRCHCDEFWMEDFLRAHFGDRESNCGQNIVYAALVVVLVILMVIAMICAAICLCKRCIYYKPKIKRHRYMLLEERIDDEEDGIKGNESLQLLRRGQKQNSSLMQSDSDFSSEDTIFINNKKPVNGSTGRIPNGSVRKSKVTA